MTVEAIQVEVDTRVYEQTADLLPMVMERLMRRDSLAGCHRCDVLLTPYVLAQIELTRARRHYHHCDGIVWDLPRSVGGLQSGYSRHRGPEAALHRLTCAAMNRDAARRAYRSIPCECLVKKKDYDPSRRG